MAPRGGLRPLALPLASLLSGVGLLVLGVGLLFSVLGLRAGLAQFSTVVTGLVMSAYFAGFVLGTLYCPRLIRAVGHVRSFAAMASVASTMPILHALWIEPIYWSVLRLFTGFCLVGLYIVVESWLTVLAPREMRGKVFGLYLSVCGGSLALGQWLLLVGDRLGFVPFVLVSVLLSFALLPITLTPVAEPEPLETPHVSLRALYRISPLGVSGAFFSGMLTGAFFGLGAVFVQRLGHPDAFVAGFMAVTILAGAVSQWPVGHLSDRYDRRMVLAVVCIGLAIASGTGYIAVRTWPIALFPVGIVLGSLLFVVYGISVAHVHDLIDARRAIEVTGGLLLVHGVGAAAGPTLAGVLMDGLGPGSLLIYFGAVASLQVVYTLNRIRFAQPVAQADKSTYVPAIGSSPAALKLDPRVPDR